MKQSPDYLLRQVAGKIVLVPVGRAARTFPGMVDLNAVGKFIWEQLREEQSLQSLVTAITDRYEVDPKRAEADARAFIERLQSVGAVTE